MSDKKQDWVVRVYSSDDHIKMEHRLPDMTEAQAGEAARLWAEQNQESDYTVTHDLRSR